MLKTITKLYHDQSGAAAAEYALMLAIVGAAIATAMFALGGEVRDAIDQAETNVATVDGGTLAATD
jgi:pilus assembly protein Flp/PilA